ncbi:MAG: 50S ribosomal protein L30 [Anaerolineae bacterium]|jgi:large subunit ribosomal protein L30
MAETNTKKLRVTLVKSGIGYNQRQKDTLIALGLRRLKTTVELPDTPQTRGMINTVTHLVKVEPAD